jgi:hypothetical protein
MHVDLSLCPPICQPCIQGKQTVEPVSKTTGRVVTECLKLVHIDLAGPSVVTGIDGSRYACTIKDTFLKYNWTSCLRTKDQAITFVQGWHKTMLTQHPKLKVKAIRLDNGELKSVAFVSWARSEGIILEFTNPTPQPRMALLSGLTALSKAAHVP